MEIINEKDIIIIGAGGHASVVIDTIKSVNNEQHTWNILGCLEDGNIKKCLEIPVIGKVDDFKNHDLDKTYFFIAIGNNEIRANIYKKMNNCKFPTLCHPNSTIGSNVNIGLGSLLMSNTIINANTIIGEHCIINTGAIVEHDCKISNFVHISPGTTLCGNVSVGESSHIGAGSVIIPNKNIVENIIIGAGSVIIRDCIEVGTYVGNPACKLN